MNRYDFGNRLCELRRAHGYTQQKLGKMLGVSNKAVSKWENGESMPRLQMLDKIAECFDLSVDELLTYGDSEPSVGMAKEHYDKPEKDTVFSNKIDMKLLMGLGWIKIDEKQVIGEIKKEYGFNNKKLAEILGTTQRKIGLWENGIERPSAKFCIRLAAFYRLNCDNGEQLNAFMNVAHDVDKNIFSLSLGIPLIMVITLLLYPLFSFGTQLFNGLSVDETPKFSFAYLFACVLPNSLMTVALYYSLHYFQANKPNILQTIKRYRLFLNTILIYLVVVILVYKLYSGVLYLLLAFGLFILIARVGFSKEKYGEVREIVLFWSAALFACCCASLGNVLYILDEQDVFVNLIMLTTFIVYMLCVGAEVVFSYLYIKSQELQKYFQRNDKAILYVTKKDITVGVCFVAVNILYFVFIEVIMLNYYSVFAEFLHYFVFND